jgi:hypothetical protein
MKIHVAIIAACVGAFVVGQANLAQAEEKTRRGGFIIPAIALQTAPDGTANKTGKRNRPGTVKKAKANTDIGAFESRSVKTSIPMKSTQKNTDCRTRNCESVSKR